MESELIGLLKPYFEKKEYDKILTGEFYAKIVELYRKYYKLENYVEEKVYWLEKKEEYSEVIANYSQVNGCVCMSYEGIIKVINFLFDKYNKIMSDNEITDYTVLEILRVICHELEHAHQTKQMNEELDTFEGYLISLSDINYLKIKRDAEAKGLSSEEEMKKAHSVFSPIYEKYYFSALFERLAQINSYILFNNILDELGVSDNVKKLFKDALNGELVKGYKDTGDFIIKSPTLEFIEKMVEIGFTSKEDYESVKNKVYTIYATGEMDTKERLVLGLPVTVVEYYEFNNVESQKNITS